MINEKLGIRPLESKQLVSLSLERKVIQNRCKYKHLKSMKSSSKKYVSHKNLIQELQLVCYISTERLMRQCGNNNVPSLLCGKWQEPSFMWKKWDHVHETLQWCRPCEPKNLVSVLVTFFFFQEQGKKASLPGCDLSDIRHCCRPVPSRAEKQNSPCLP